MVPTGCARASPSWRAEAEGEGGCPAGAAGAEGDGGCPAEAAGFGGGEGDGGCASSVEAASRSQGRFRIRI